MNKFSLILLVAFALNSGQSYFFSIRPFNEKGISKATDPLRFN